MTPADLVELRELVLERGVEVLVVDDLRTEDLERLAWSGSAAHLRSVGRQLDRKGSGEVDYLVLRAPGGAPVAKAGIDYAVAQGRGVIWQVAVHEALQGLGLGTRLFELSEGRLRARGCRVAVLSVEVDNPRARALYERLGYRPLGTRATGWEVDDPDGRVGWYTTEVVDMEKPLPSSQS